MTVWKRGNDMENYLYPFFWQHGESAEVIEHYMEKICSSGMKAVCVEARPHPEFVRQGWWDTMETIVKKAKEYGMKLWILDDSHFPTGYANGKIKECYPQYRKLYLNIRRFDVAGSMKGARINANILKGRPWTTPGLGDKKILGVYMAERRSSYYEKNDDINAETLTELEGAFSDGIITLDIPKGSYSVFVVFTTYEGGEETTKDYLNPLVPEATKVLLEEVYEPHYEHFREEFGKTILGFFSDEPRFGNRKGTEAVLGTDMPLPWREHLEEELSFDPKYLPLLWFSAGGAEKGIRYTYMDTVTKLYRDHFTKVLSDWCEEHGVWYLGHNIEDNGAHARLGYGTGHYFRGQESQHLAGVDVIGTQIVPGMPYHHDAFSTGGCNGEFYHYALAKLASSAAHLDPKKEGRAMCEAFGAYGWNEGLKLMKWITDHLIVRGINYIVPHAFDPKAFPDWDCPPHFYAQGNNPQFRYFPVYTNYVNRLLTLLSGSRSTAKTGVLYHAELEWCGECMPIERVIRELTEHQIDCEIISEDYLEQMEIKDGKYIINGQGFDRLIVPSASAVPLDLFDRLAKMQEEGVSVVWVRSVPEQIICGTGKMIPFSEKGKNIETAELKEIGELCADLREFKMEEMHRELVFSHYRKEETDLLLLFNENVEETLDTWAKFDFMEGKNIYRYDAFADDYYEMEKKNGACHLTISPYEMTVLIVTKEEKTDAKQAIPCSVKKWSISENWDIRFADKKSYPEFKEAVPTTHLGSAHQWKEFSDRAGTLSYETGFTCEKRPGRAWIVIDQVYETAEVFVNGKTAGVRICPPYRYEITDLLRQGENSLRIEVTNTLGAEVRDGLSQYLVIEPFGILGDVVIEEEPETI